MSVIPVKSWKHVHNAASYSDPLSIELGNLLEFRMVNLYSYWKQAVPGGREVIVHYILGNTVKFGGNVLKNGDFNEIILGNRDTSFTVKTEKQRKCY